jgi:hypothetical protein
MKSTVLGSVAEGATLHVVYRYSTELLGTSVSKVQVLSVKKDELGWRLLLPTDAADIVNAVNSKLSGGH